MIKKISRAALIAFMAYGTVAVADNYPSKSISIIVPSNAGGSTDTTARIFAEVAEKKYPGFEFVVNNMGGSGGQKGFEAIARAKPDGYTLGLNFTPQLVAHVASKRAQYTLSSFHIMGNIAEDPGIVVVPKDSAINSLSDFAKASKDGSLTVSVNGIGSDDFLAAKSFEKLTGATFNLLPTKGSTEQKAGILGGHVDGAFMNLSQMLSQHNAGDAKIIAILTKKRDASAQDIPTAQEQGFDVYMTATRGFVAPAGIDPAIQARLDSMFDAVVADAEFTAKTGASKIQLWTMNGSDYRAYLEDLLTTTQSVYDSAPW